MEQKTKIIVIIVGAFLLIGIIFLAIVNSSLTKENRGLKDDKVELTRQNETLAAKFEQERKEKNDLRQKLNEMNRSLDEAQRNRDELQKKYEQVAKERDNILKELTEKKKEEAQGAQQQPKPLAGATDEAYWSGILKTKADLELMVSNLKDELATLKNNLDGVEKEKTSLKLDIDNLTNDKNDISAKLIYNEKMIDLLSLDLVREKKDKRKLQDNFKVVREENENLKRELKSVNKQKVSLEAKFLKTEADRQDLEKRVLAVNASLDDKTTDILDLKDKLDEIKEEKGIKHIKEQKASESVELPPIVVSSQELATAASAIKGKVLEVSKENNFVVIDIGEDSGVRRAMTFQVYRGPNRIGSIEVVQTRRSVSACDIKQAIEPIRVGDIVK